MMKKVLFAILVFICLSVMVYGVRSIYQVSQTTDSDQLRILVAYNPKYSDQNSHILAAYASVLSEEGIPFETIDQHLLLAVDPTTLSSTVPAVIFPDAVCQRMPIGYEPWIADYLGGGGAIALIYDPAVKDSQDAYLPNTFIRKFSGVDHIHFARMSGETYTVGNLRFVDSDVADKCQIPYGKLDKDLFLTGYGYGRLQYPVARSELVKDLESRPPPQVLAEAVVNDSEVYPAIVTRRYDKGSVFYVNLPLGHLKAHADDLPLRSMLRYFLFETLRIPHLMNVPFGKGGLVFNWHHDTNGDWPYLEQMIEAGFFRTDLEYSMHITAGDSVEQPGDGEGFDACGQGKRFVEMLKPFGTIGSHGGWYHNWFAANIESGKFDKAEIEAYISKNNRCLESLTGQKITEYSAPDGAHPQPSMTEILSAMEIMAYYYTGDSGSAPNRSFNEGEMLSDRMFAFPVMPFTDKASMVELIARRTPAPEVQKWLQRTVDYVIENRTVRLLYSHPYDLFQTSPQHGYQSAFLSFIEYMDQAQAEGRLTVKPMSYFAKFMSGMLDSTSSYRVLPNGLEIKVKKPVGLAGLTLAVPADRFQPPDDKKIDVRTGSEYYYLTMEPTIDETRIFIRSR